MPDTLTPPKARKAPVKQIDCLRVDFQVAIPIDAGDPKTLVEADALVEAAFAAFGKKASVTKTARLGKCPSTWFPTLP